MMIRKNVFVSMISQSIMIAFLAVSANAPAAAHEDDEDSAEGPQTQATSVEAQAVIDALSGFAQAVASTDMTEIERFVITSDEFSYIEGTHVDWGWSSYRDDHLGPEMVMFEDTEYQFTDIRPYVSGDLSYASFDYVMNVTIRSDQFEGGQHRVNMEGRGTAILTNTDDGWKIRHMQTARKTENSNEASLH